MSALDLFLIGYALLLIWGAFRNYRRGLDGEIDW